MKAIPALLAMVMNALASPGDPGETAVRYLEKIRNRDLNLEPGSDTALSAQTSETKRKEIARRLERMVRDLGSDPLEAGSVKLDGDLAAVLVRKIGGFDPSRLQVFPVALVKRESGWIAAPLPASFENTGVGYAAAVRKRIESLESWMLNQRAFDLEQLREQSTARMRNAIEAIFPKASLQGLDARQTAEKFLTACERGNQEEIFGLMGGLSAQLPADWQLRLKAADTAISDPSAAHRPWRLLMAQEILRIPVYEETEDDFAMISIACLDPAGTSPESKTPKVEIVHLELSKAPEGFWRVDPPSAFLQGEASADPGDDDGLDADLLDLFPVKLALKYPATPMPSAGAAKDALVAAFADSKPSSWARLIRTLGDPPEARETCARAASLWWETRDRLTGRRVIPLAFHEAGDQAALASQFFDARNPDRLDLRMLYFEKTPMGWMWAPIPSEELRKALNEWTESQVEEWQDGWQKTLLRDCPKIDHIPAVAAPGEDEARKLVESWLIAIREGDLMRALGLTTRLHAPDGDEALLRNLGYELTGARRSTQPTTITQIRRSGQWVGVGAKMVSGEATTYPFYPVISTPAGPRILLEVDLLVSSNRSRDYLNKTSLGRLKKRHPEAAEDLQKLFAAHQLESKAQDRP